MKETIHPANESAITSDADVLRAADAWQVKGFSVADAVQAQTTFGARVSQMETSMTAAKAYWNANQIPCIDLTRHKPEASAVAVLPAEVARTHRVVPIRKVANKLWVAMENPLNVQAIDAVRMASRCIVIPMACVLEGTFDYELARVYPQTEPEPTENRASENVAAELVALVRDLQNEVRDLKQEVQGLKKQVVAQQLTPQPTPQPTLDARPAVFPAPRVFRATPAAQPPFPLFRD